MGQETQTLSICSLFDCVHIKSKEYTDKLLELITEFSMSAINQRTHKNYISLYKPKIKSEFKKNHLHVIKKYEFSRTKFKESMQDLSQKTYSPKWMIKIGNFMWPQVVALSHLVLYPMHLYQVPPMISLMSSASLASLSTQ